MKGGDGGVPQGITFGSFPSKASSVFVADPREVAIDQELETCLALSKRDFPGAIRRLKSDLLENPTPERTYYMAILDLDLHHRDFSDAYRVVACVLNLFGDPTRNDVPQNPDNELLLRASLAASMIGEVYKGQREFCVKVIDPHKEPSCAKDYPQGDSPDDVACLSCLGLGGIDFLELALKLDPGDPSASCSLGDLYGDAFQYSKAIKVLESGLKRNDSGFAHDWMVNTLRAVRYDLATVGDGNPVITYGPASSAIHP